MRENRTPGSVRGYRDGGENRSAALRKERIMNIIRTHTVGFSALRLDRIRTGIQPYVDQGRLLGTVTMIAWRGSIVRH